MERFNYPHPDPLPWGEGGRRKNFMPKRKLYYFILSLLAALSLVLAFQIYHAYSNTLRVIFLDIGQGDAILVMYKNNQILIDGGPSGNKIMEKLGKHIPFWDRKIELVIATHPDQDHIAGLVDVLKNYEIGAVMENGQENDTQVYKRLEEVIGENNIQKIIGETGISVKEGGDLVMDILSPDKESLGREKDTNANSIVAKLTFGKNSFLFTGDLPIKEEDKLVQNNADLVSMVLKAGHHGSKYSTGDNFLGKVSPREAVISSGKNNSYGHPHPEVLERLEKRRIKIWRTDEMGDVEYECEESECVVRI